MCRNLHGQRPLLFVGLILLGMQFSLAQAESDRASSTGEIQPTGIHAHPEYGTYLSDALAGKVYRLVDGVLELVTDDLSRPWGLHHTADGRLCVSHYTSENPSTRASAVSCRGADGWSAEIVGVRSGINGIARVGDSLWLAVWQDTPVESRDGYLVKVTEGEIEAELFLPSQLPQFVLMLPNGNMLVTTWEEDAAGFTGGSVLRISPAGEITTFSDALDLPAGIAYDGSRVWVADRTRGALVALDDNGEEVFRRDGLASPLGVAVVDQSFVCVNESTAERTTCIHLENHASHFISWR